MIEFSEKETEFLNSLEEARIATSHEDIPHVKPVSFVLYKNAIIVATDYETRTYKNLKTNPNTSVVIDIYKSGGHKAIVIQGKTEIIENGAGTAPLFNYNVNEFVLQRFENQWPLFLIVLSPES